MGDKEILEFWDSLTNSQKDAFKAMLRTFVENVTRRLDEVREEFHDALNVLDSFLR